MPPLTELEGERDHVWWSLC